MSKRRAAPSPDALIEDLSSQVLNLQKTVKSYREDLEETTRRHLEAVQTARALRTDLDKSQAEVRDLNDEVSRGRRKIGERQRVIDAFVNMAGRIR